MTLQTLSEAKPSMHFFLLPDRSSARRVRRLVAERGGALNLIVGTWPELLGHAQKAYLLPEKVSDWTEKLAEAAGSVKDAFWSASHAVAPEETEAVLGGALSFLLEGAGTGGRLRLPPPGTLSGRAQRHLDDLFRLHEAMGFLLPPHLAGIADVLTVDPERAVRHIAVYCKPEMPSLNSWQEALQEKLGEDCGGNEPLLADLYSELTSPKPAGKDGTALRSLQQGLFGGDGEIAAIDDSVQCLAVRDFLEEIEVAVGMVQQALADNPQLSTADIGILVPDDRSYLDSLRIVAAGAGLPLSGLPTEKTVRDLGREAVHNFLLTCRRPAPAMALATLLTSPLMPWEAKFGNEMAQDVMEGSFDLKAPSATSINVKRMLKLLRQGTDSGSALKDSLATFGSLLSDLEGLEGQRARAIATIERVLSVPTHGGEVPWNDLLRLAAPETISVSVPRDLTCEGIALFTEHEEPWRQVKQLFVLGFSAGHYPAEPPRSAIFADADLANLQNAAGYAIKTPEEDGRHRRALFLRQIGGASERVNFFIPRRDCFGKELRPSQSLTYMATLFGCADQEDLLLELERSDVLGQVRGLATVPALGPILPRLLQRKDLSLRRDLLLLRHNEDGSPKPQSPSSLDMLMVSPFAWLLSRAYLQPREWAPEALDVATKGTLAHDVFEHLFIPGKSLPTVKAIRAGVPGLLNQAIIRIKPFLLGPEWHVERRHLQREIELAALRWKELLAELGATILGNEVLLRGQLGTLPILGRADLLLELPQGRLYVVDYKKAGSKQRRERMTKGYDSQASLYRLMIETGAGNNADESLKKALEGAQEISVAYFMLNDQVALTDSSGWVGRGVVGVEELGDGISDNAMDLIRQRVSELRSGTVVLNHVDDEKWYKSNAGITIYALDTSPLIPLFMKSTGEPGPCGGAEASPVAGGEGAQ